MVTVSRKKSSGTFHCSPSAVKSSRPTRVVAGRERSAAALRGSVFRHMEADGEGRRIDVEGLRVGDRVVAGQDQQDRGDGLVEPAAGAVGAVHRCAQPVGERAQNDAQVAPDLGARTLGYQLDRAGDAQESLHPVVRRPLVRGCQGGNRARLGADGDLLRLPQRAQASPSYDQPGGVAVRGAAAQDRCGQALQEGWTER